MSKIISLVVILYISPGLLSLVKAVTRGQAQIQVEEDVKGVCLQLSDSRHSATKKLTTGPLEPTNVLGPASTSVLVKNQHASVNKIADLTPIYVSVGLGFFMSTGILILFFIWRKKD